MRVRVLTFLLSIALTASAAPQAIDNYLHLPLAFERRGAGADETFVARSQGYAIGIQRGKATIQTSSKTFSLEFAGAKSPAAVTGSLLPGKVNYIHGNDPKKWQTGLSTYGRVTYPGLYPGVDLVYYGNQQQIEFDLAVKPGADPRAIRMKVGGGAKLAIDGSGDLRIGEDGVKIALPKIYQDVNGTKQAIAGHYVLRGTNEVGFEMGAWDHARPLVIDPTILVGPGIILSTLLGGSTSGTNGEAIAYDSAGNIYLAGSTSAADFVPENQVQSGTNGSPDGFVTKVSPAGKLVYSTYFGGSSTDVFYSVAADANGNAWVTGFSSSTDFPLMNATQPAYGGGTDAVVVEFTSSGALAFSTYLGGSSKDEGFGIAVDKSNNAYITGYTNGSFPVTPGVIQSAPQGSNDIFVAKYTSSDTVAYSTLLGGSGSEEGSGIAVDSTGNAYITGPTSSAAFVPPNPAGGAQPVYGGGSSDAFVAKLNPTATALVYFTYLGGSNSDDGYAIAVDSNLNAYIAGNTESAGLATAGSAQTVYAGGFDGLAAQLNPTGTKFNYITYLGGSRNDYLLAVAADSLGNAYVTGYTDSANLPTVLPLQASLANPTSLLQTTNSGTSWSAFDGNIPGAVFDVSPDPVASGTIVAATELGVYRTTNNGTAWTPELSGSFPSLALARSPVTPSTIYLLQSTGETRISIDNGVTWTVGGTGAANVPNGIVADGATANTAYSFSTSQGVYVTTNGGTSWAASNKGLPNNNVVAMAAGTDGSIYAAVSNNGIYKSTNQGASWTAIDSGIPAPNTPVAHSIWVNPKTPSDLAFSTGGHVYFSTNGGTSWAPAASFFPGANSAAISGAADGSILYAATTTGNVYSLMPTANSPSWVLAGTVLTPSGITSLEVDPLNDAHVFAVMAVPTAAIVAKINSTGSAFLYSTYLGGTGSAAGTGIITAGAGQIGVTGYAVGTGFPVTVEHIPSTSQTQAFAVVVADTAASCTYQINPAATTITGFVQTVILSVTAPNGCSWSASSSPGATVSSAPNSGSGIIVVQMAANLTGSTLNATVVAGGQSATITQAMNACTYSLDQSTYFEPTAGATFTANLTTQAGCVWAVENVAPYAVAINSGASGTGPGPISITVGPSANGNQRNLSLPVGNTAIDITQYGTCAYTPASASVNAPASGASNSVSFTASAPYCSTFPVLLSNAPWLTVTGSSLGLNYTAAANTGAARSGTITIAGGGTFTVNQSAAGGSVPAFFNGEDSLSGGVYYLQFPDGNPFGYYNFPSASILYHYDMGFEAFVAGSAADVYLYDFASTHWWYTSTTLFPYLYDFTLSNWLYYFPNTANPGHYTANPRYFSDLTTGQIITQ